MPATAFIFWERRGRLAADARQQFAYQPVVFHEARSEASFRKALHAAMFPVVILERAAARDCLPEIIAEASNAGAWVVVLGKGTNEERRRDLDLGAHLLMDDAGETHSWRGTERRLLAASQERFAATTPVRDPVD